MTTIKFSAEKGNIITFCELSINTMSCNCWSVGCSCNKWSICLKLFLHEGWFYMNYDISVMYYRIRFIIAIILSVFLFVLLIKRKVKFNTSSIGSIVFFLLFYIVSGLLPIENLRGFKTSERAFNYTNNAPIVSVDEYDDYAVIIGKNDEGGIVSNIILKENGLWKINVYPPNKETFFTVNKKAITRYYISNSNDYVIYIYDSYKVTDSRGTEFKQFSIDYNHTVYYGVIQNINSNYELYVDGETVKFV